MAPMEIFPDLDHYQLEPSCFGSKSHLSSFQKSVGRAMYLSTAAALDLHRMYLPPLRNDGISRSQLLPGLNVLVLETVEMKHQKGFLLDDRTEFRWIYDKECPTSMLYLLIGSSEVNGDDSNVD